MSTTRCLLEDPDPTPLPDLPYREALHDMPNEPPHRSGFRDLPAATLVKSALAKGYPMSRCAACHGTMIWSKSSGSAGRFAHCATCGLEVGRLPCPDSPATALCPFCSRPVPFGRRVSCLACGFDKTRELVTEHVNVKAVVSTQRTCARSGCRKTFAPTKRQTYCSDSCRVLACRRRGRQRRLAG